MKIKVLIFIVFLAGLVFSCKKSQKITQNSANKKETNKPLNEQQETAFKEFFFTANKEKILGNYDAAIIAFEKCVQINPSADAPYFEMALLKADQNKNQEALFLAEKAAQL